MDLDCITNTCNFIEGQDKIPNNIGSGINQKLCKSSRLVCCISYSFLYIISYNNSNNKNYCYLYDSNDVNQTFNDVFRYCKSKTHNKLFEEDISKKKSVVKVNIYHERSLYDKDLFKSYLLNGNEHYELYNELIEIFNSEYFNNWNKSWIQIILEQMLIFFCCIKGGFVCERLLDCAAITAKSLSLKFKYELLHYKYSYQYFIEVIINKFIYENKKIETINNFYKFDLEEDIVDGFAIISFLTKEELNKYTEQLTLNNCFQLFPVEKKSSEISEVSVEPMNYREDQCCTSYQTSSNRSKPKIIDRFLDSEFLDEFLSSNSNLNYELPLQKLNNSSNLKKEFCNRITNLSSNECRIKLNNQDFKFNCRHLPVIHGCNKFYNNTMICSCKQFSLCMVVNIGNGYTLTSEARENLEKLELNRNTISPRMAMIAACALKTRKASKRIVVPVVLESIVNIVKKWEKCVPCPSVEEGTSEICHESQIDGDVVSLLNDIIQNIENNSEVSKSENKIKLSKSKPKYLRELRRLDAKIIEDSIEKDKFFKNDKMNTMNLFKKTKRQKIVSTRLLNAVLLDEKSLPMAKVSLPARLPWKRRSKKLNRNNKSNNIQFKETASIMRRLAYSTNITQGKKTLCDVFIWCARHNRYNCLCVTFISRTKQNTLIWKPQKQLRYMTNNFLKDIEINYGSECQVSFFDSSKHCSRTFGTPIDYITRNSSEIFLTKRKYEIKNNTISSTNSYIKYKFSIFNNNERFSNEKLINNDVFIGKCLQYVHVEKENLNASNEIVVCDENTEIKHCDTIVVSDDEDSTSVQKIITSEEYKKNSHHINRVQNSSKPFINNYLINQNFNPDLEYSHIKLQDHPLKDEIYNSENLPKLGLLCITPDIGYLPIVEYNQEVLIVQDPILPQLLHRFKNLNTANIWLNIFFKNFLIIKSLQICLKWIIVKPGILRLKQCQPFTPTILENKSFILNKHGNIMFIKNFQKNHINYLSVKDKNKIDKDGGKKRKLDEMKDETSNIIVDIFCDDGKRRKIQLACNNKDKQIGIRQYPPKKKKLLSNSYGTDNSIALVDNRTVGKVLDLTKTSTSSSLNHLNSDNINQSTTYTIMPAKVYIVKKLSSIVPVQGQTSTTPTLSGPKIVTYTGRPIILTSNFIKK